MGKTYKVYKHTCPNGKSYIGITGMDEKLRWNYGNGYTTQLFGKAVKKYGWENIRHEILEVCDTIEEANTSEMKYIALYETTNPAKGYNCDKGGSGSVGHIVGSAARKSISNANKTKWADPKYREKMVAHLRSVSDGNIGRKRKRCSIEKTIAATIKQVDQYSIDGNFVATHSSLMDAARAIGKKNNTDIVRCCKGIAVTAHGFIWRYHGEPLDYEAHLERLRKWESSATATAKANAVKNCIPIQQEDDLGNVIAVYASAAEAEKKTGINRNNIRQCCKGNLKHAGNYVWRERQDHLIILPECLGLT